MHTTLHITTEYTAAVPALILTLSLFYDPNLNESQKHAAMSSWFRSVLARSGLCHRFAVTPTRAEASSPRHWGHWFCLTRWLTQRSSKETPKADPSDPTAGRNFWPITSYAQGFGQLSDQDTEVSPRECSRGAAASSCIRITGLKECSGRARPARDSDRRRRHGTRSCRTTRPSSSRSSGPTRSAPHAQQG